MTTLETLKDKYTEVRQRIGAAAKKSGRTADSVILVAVTKTAEPDQIREMIRFGHADFGESRVQQLIQRAAIIDEWMARQRSMPGVQWQRAGSGDGLAGQAPAKPGTGLPQAVRWHMIGHLQRNKARKAVEICRLIHSVDSLRLVEELQLIGLKREKPIEVLLQVNCSLEPQKYGCAIAAAAHLAEQIETMVHVQVRGLMTMASATATPDEVRKTFERCRELFLEIRDSGVAGSRFNILSMGMSGDFEMAIEEGANLVRVGTALFGEAKPGMEDGSDEEDDD
ncbi:MAG TPA: YggS family pyridoxal phosphate-dependent enzyme [Phycisphaerales bacterium]|jgi:pyridoxal phosphate enzyme (YggS family)|nr:YggS family pyridoxal phosphate-dependent enzyme [Phycisphaerales bacterium]